MEFPPGPPRGRRTIGSAAGRPEDLRRFLTKRAVREQIARRDHGAVADAGAKKKGNAPFRWAPPFLPYPFGPFAPPTPGTGRRLNIVYRGTPWRAYIHQSILGVGARNRAGVVRRLNRLPHMMQWS